MLDTLRSRERDQPADRESNRVVTVRMPRSLHEALKAEAADRRLAFGGFTVDDALMDVAAPEAIFLHCLPAHRGEEVSDAVLEGPRSRVWQQATNRMHAARGALVWLMEHR